MFRLLLQTRMAIGTRQETKASDAACMFISSFLKHHHLRTSFIFLLLIQKWAQRDISLLQQFSNVICGPLGMVFPGDPWGQNYFHKIWDITCLFHCINICCDGTKAMVTQHKSRQWDHILAMIVLFTDCTLHHNAPTLKKRKPTSLKNILDETVKKYQFY